jgi:hypothetical protein
VPLTFAYTPGREANLRLIWDRRRYHDEWIAVTAQAFLDHIGRLIALDGSDRVGDVLQDRADMPNFDFRTD